MAKMRFKLVEGKHQMDDGSFIRGPIELNMEESEAARFPNKFVLVTAPVEADPEAEAELVATTPGTPANAKAAEAAKVDPATVPAKK
jgi:hypothetical protein